MTDETPRSDASSLVRAAAAALAEKKDEVNKLNVFPVPDGDTGTNMSLTMDAVVTELDSLAEGAGATDVCHAVTHASLMGARGNSGVILSQILRGLCDVISESEDIGPETVAEALERATTVAFQAVRKPVEGTMLTVLKDAGIAARAAVEAGADLDTVLRTVVDEAFASVDRGPELLPVLKENGVVDSGGYGLAIMAQGCIAAAFGQAVGPTLSRRSPAAALTVVPVDDWDDTEHLYCTEFLIFGEGLDRAAVEEFISARGGSELVVGDESALKVHVHTDVPAEVLGYATSIGEIAEVHVNNMRRQTAQRSARLVSEQAATTPAKAVGFVAVAAGAGLAGILKSLGVDEVVSGGQTMNPSTAELLGAIRRVNAETVVVLPNNRNIVLAAQQAASAADKPVRVVPTVSVPQAFAAMLAADASAPIDTLVDEMTSAASAVRTGEVTTAIKDANGKAGAIRAGDVIGIVDHEIEVIGRDVADVVGRLVDVLADGGEMLTLLAGEDLDDASLASLKAAVAAAHPELEVEAHRGDQPVYPVIVSVE